MMHFIFILDYGNDVSKKANLWFFFFYSTSKWVLKQAETTHNINNAFGPGIANKCTAQWWFKKFWKGGNKLEDEECSGQPSKADNQLRAIIKADSLTTTWEFWRTQHWPSYGHLPFEVNWKVKELDKWVLCELTENQKNHYFEVSSSLIPHSNNEPLLDRIVMWDKVDFLWQPVNYHLSS